MEIRLPKKAWTGTATANRGPKVNAFLRPIFREHKVESLALHVIGQNWTAPMVRGKALLLPLGGDSSSRCRACPPTRSPIVPVPRRTPRATTVWARLPAKQLGRARDEKTNTVRGAPFDPKK